MLKNKGITSIELGTDLFRRKREIAQKQGRHTAVYLNRVFAPGDTRSDQSKSHPISIEKK